ncbi:MAG TPA: FAD-binding and (Fe-S)-binding domain-containing protein [Gemmatimonadales bacterium]|jgi:FAD/FMN-containing dehydrogenase/Fe-S oxidoreductase|nr:FAD-binding and (Fe-S)-binding domain-containing protein [Gemmatimonadales bacterium]
MPSDPGPDLARELRRRIGGEVRFDAGSRAAYSTDASNYRQVPLGVVIPRDTEDVVATVALCRKYAVPLTSRGGGTSLAGQTCNAGVILDHSKYCNRVLEIDGSRRLARVEPGCNLDALRHEAERRVGLTFGPDPATHNRATLGGMIGNNSCGVHSVLAQFYGPGPLTRHQVRALEVLTYDGQRLSVGPTSAAELDRIAAGTDRRGVLYRGMRDLRDRHAGVIRHGYPDIPRRVSGFNLDALLPEHGFHVAQALVGTEGTCVVVLGATVTLIDPRPERVLLVLGYSDVFSAGDQVPEILAHRPAPIGLEGFDGELVAYLRKKRLHTENLELLPEGGGWLLVEFGAERLVDAKESAERLMAELRRSSRSPAMRLLEDPAEARRLWQVREAGLGATALVPGMRRTHEGWEDAAVPPAVVGAYLREFRALLREFDYHTALYGHFGQGCIHCRIDFDLESAAGINQWLAFLERASDLVLKYGGSFSGEHGDGQSRGWLLPKLFGPELAGAFREFKRLWDPDGKLNPGKVVDPYGPDQHLREGPAARWPRPATYFALAEDGGSFSRAAARCVGVGACRRAGGGVMCPSYMVTREEHHSTRGRARLLFELMQGEVLRDGWREPAVREALDLCLACKGCKTECPVNVDMATYKAEFLSHYYHGRLRPRAAYATGLIHWWARLASPIAPLANALADTRPFSPALKWLAGFPPERTLPRFARPTLAAWFRRRARNAAAPAGRRVLLWPDTFTNYFRPEAGRAAVTVLERAGFAVELPSSPSSGSLCCGRPLYDWGMLDLAKRLWTRTLHALRPAIRDGIPIVGIEPSCVASFRDELPGLFPHDLDARALSRQVVLLSEFLETAGFVPPRLAAKALVHGHCHHRTVLGFAAEEALLRKLGLEYQLLDSGCCGMAGGFGFERKKYPLSVALAERVLLPAIRSAPAGTWLIADGFSCREQIRQLAGRETLHLAEVLDRALAATPVTRGGTP